MEFDAVFCDFPQVLSKRSYIKLMRLGGSDFFQIPDKIDSFHVVMLYLVQIGLLA